MKTYQFKVVDDDGGDHGIWKFMATPPQIGDRMRTMAQLWKVVAREWSFWDKDLTVVIRQIQVDGE